MRKERRRRALRWRRARVEVRVSGCILLIYIRRIHLRQRHASEKENAPDSENALSSLACRGSNQKGPHLTESLRQKITTI